MKKTFILFFVFLFIQINQSLQGQTPIPLVGSGCAMDFDGNTDYIEVPPSLAFEPGNGAITVSVWIKASNFPVGADEEIIEWYHCGSIPNCSTSPPYGRGMYKLKIRTDGRLRWEVRDNDNTQRSVNSAQSVVDNKWHFLTGTLNLQTGDIKMYIDGVFEDDNNANFTTISSMGDDVSIQIGREITNNFGTVEDYNGEMDEIRIWDYERTEEQIQTDMCRSLQGDEGGLIAYWNFDDCQGDVLTDQTGNGHDGVIHNDPTWITSDAPIGQESAYIYADDWNGVDLSLVIDGEDEFIVQTIEDNTLGVHIYSIQQEPNSLNGIDIIPNNERYYGVFTVSQLGDPTPSYEAKYNYTANPFVTDDYQDSVRLYKRFANSNANWSSIPGINNIFDQEIFTDNENYRAEYILGLGETSCNFELGEDISICSPDSFEIVLPGDWLAILWNTGDTTQSITAITSGEYYVNVVDTLGCTSADSIIIAINPVYDLLVETSICEGDSILLEGIYQTEAGTYFDTFSTVAGCDSIVTTELSLVFPTFGVIDVTACDSYFSPAENMYEETGTYEEIIENVVGCDSIITINLTINNTSTANHIFEACDSFTSPSGMDTWTISGNYTDTLTNSLGCDSVLFIDLTINESTFSVLTPIDICDVYLSPAGNTYTESDTYNETITNAAGCDSLITINLIINETPNVAIIEPTELICVRETQFEIESEEEGGTWTGNGIQDSDSGIIDPTSIGLGTHTFVYEFVESSEIICPSSNSIEIEVIDCEELWQHIYVPNIFSPNSDKSNDIYFIYGDRVAEMTLVIFDRWGEKVFETNDIESGWDGTFNGELVNASILAFQLSGKFISGLEFEDSGYITLIR